MLALDDVSKRFGGLKVIDGLSFEVAASERVALIGPNGAGKTTAFNLITGAYPVDSGRVLLDGIDITALPARKRIRHGLARTFQNIRLMAHLSVIENVMITQATHSGAFTAMLQPVNLWRENRWRREALDVLAAAGLGRYADEPTGALPYGIQKQVELVRALLAKPRVLLLDEPAAGLNPAETDALRERLEMVSRSGIAIVVVEHDMHFIGAFCRRVIVLNFGCKIAECATGEVHAHPRVREAYLGSESEAFDVEAA
ncbi:MAG: ABC transporter ATP-binding protein [Burkholderiales bacterium]|nr:ABC transporter ATP-binding protein [Burkholderiales bacterium]